GPFRPRAFPEGLVQAGHSRRGAGMGPEPAEARLPAAGSRLESRTLRTARPSAERRDARAARNPAGRCLSTAGAGTDSPARGCSALVPSARSRGVVPALLRTREIDGFHVFTAVVLTRI